MKPADKIRVKAQVDKIKAKPQQQITKEETDYCIRHENIIPDEET